MDLIEQLTTETFPAFCRERGLKCTAQRIAVLAAVLRVMGRHPSVDGIWEAVKKSIPTVARESVYRILNEFDALGIVARLDSLSAARYDTSCEPPAHFICEVCGSVTDHRLSADFALPDGIRGELHHLELRVTGICDKCLKHRKRRK